MLTLQTEWVYKRMELYRVWIKNPDDTQRQLAERVGHSVRWVKKWIKRFRERESQGFADMSVFAEASRAPKNPVRKVTRAVRDVILSLRTKLPEKYGRVVGAKPILHHLHKDGYFLDDVDLPTSSATIWRVLKEAGYIPERIRTHVPLDPSAPMEEWEFDFGEVKIASDAHFEFAPIIDRGTSILIDAPLQSVTYQADTTLERLIEVFRQHGYPRRFRFDRDPRLIGSVGMDDFPSALMRFMWCIGLEPVICPPRRPDLKPYVERVIRSIKHERLYVKKPANESDARDCLDEFLTFYNQERAHQGLSCGNQPPRIAHPDLPSLRQLPKRINPDAWLAAYHGEIFKRQVSANGSISVDNHHYQVGRKYALQVAAVHLDADQKVFHITVGDEQLPLKPIQGLHHRFMDFDEYADLMIAEARAIARQQR